jgi:hypothetical protein
MSTAKWTRREFLRTSGAVGVAGFPCTLAQAEPPLETTRLRLVLDPGICFAPQFVVI